MHKFYMKVTYPKIYIDMRPCFSEIGLKNIRELGSYYAKRGLKKAQEAASYYASLGDRLMDFKHHNIAEVGHDAFKGPLEYNVGVVPRSRPRVKVVLGNVKVDILA